MRIVVAGSLAGRPGDGAFAWSRLAWSRGLRDLGIRVVFVEELDPTAWPDGGERNLGHFREICAESGLNAVLLHPGGEALAGLSTCDLLEFAEGADLLVNLDGHLRYPPVLRAVQRRVWVDLEPGLVQERYLAGEPGLGLADHDLHFTVGRNVGTPRCGVPTGGLHWIPIRPPVVLEDWPETDPPPALRFTSLAGCAAAAPERSRNGTPDPSSDMGELRRLAGMPLGIGVLVEVALGEAAEPEDGALLARSGWRLADASEVAHGLESFRAYVRTSGAELAVSPSRQVTCHSGWVSPVSARYLATGRPVVMQDTGCGAGLPLGEGILSYATAREAATAARDVVRNYDRHRRAARHVAERYFDSRRVLTRLLERAIPVGRGRPLRASVKDGTGVRHATGPGQDVRFASPSRGA